MCESGDVLRVCARLRLLAIGNKASEALVHMILVGAVEERGTRIIRTN